MIPTKPISQGRRLPAAALRLLSNDTLALSILGGLVAAAVLGFQFNAPIEIVGAVLILGFVTAMAEARLRAK